MKADIKLSEDGVRDGTPFEFKYSCMETRKVKPLKLREEKLKEIETDETSTAKVSISTTTEIYASKTSPDNAGRQYWLILGYIDRTLTTTSSESDASLERAPECLVRKILVN
ncbi:hypothetical protein NC652_039787 [Populus alba x Populus x berolinensis]|nr:hypothetical protein NC652_039787 [Populus alba x Populus x berolinensis]